MSDCVYRVAERFVSINGEGRRAGELAVFIRFAGCNLRCSYCDTAWAWGYDARAEEMTAAEIIAYIRDCGVRNVTLTGGEPLTQPGIIELLRELADHNKNCEKISEKNLDKKSGKNSAEKISVEKISVEIETNGSVDVSEVCCLADRPLLTMDYKLPDSGMESNMLTENFAYLDGRDVVKFVCGSRSDLMRATEIMREYDLIDRVGVFLSPVFGRIDPAEMVEFIKERRLNGVKIQLQLHKFIWPPEMRGV